MSEIIFYFNDAERIELVEYILKQGCFFIPEIKYSSQNAELIKINSLEIFGKNLKDKNYFFILSPKYQKEPLVLSKNPFFKEPHYRIVRRTGGPYIDFLLFEGYHDESPIQYKSGWISLYSKFIHYNSKSEFLASTEVKQVYAAIIKYIKQKSKPRKIYQKRYWISHSVLKELDMDKE